SAGRAARTATPAAGRGGAALLGGPQRGGDRRGAGDQSRHRQEPVREGAAGPAELPGIDFDRWRCSVTDERVRSSLAEVFAGGGARGGGGAAGGGRPGRGLRGGPRAPGGPRAGAGFPRRSGAGGVGGSSADGGPGGGPPAAAGRPVRGVRRRPLPVPVAYTRA